MRRLFRLVQVVMFLILSGLLVGVLQPSDHVLPIVDADTILPVPPTATVDIYSVVGATNSGTLVVSRTVVAGVDVVLQSIVTDTIDPTMARTSALAVPYDVSVSGNLGITYSCTPTTANFTTTSTLVLSVTDDSGGPFNVTYTFNCHSIYNSTPIITGAILTTDFTPNPVLDDDAVGATAPFTITNSNLGGANPALVGTVQMQVGSDPQLTVTAGAAFNLAAGANSVGTVRCLPGGNPGPLNGVLQVDVTAPVVRQFLYNVDCAVTGTPEYNLQFNALNVTPPGPINIGNVLVGQSFTVDPLLRVTNQGVPAPNAALNATLNETGGNTTEFSLGGAVFTPDSPAVVNVPASAFQDVAVDCQPFTDGVRSITMQVTHDDVLPAAGLTSPVNYTVQCTGVRPVLAAPTNIVVTTTVGNPFPASSFNITNSGTVTTVNSPPNVLTGTIATALGSGTLIATLSTPTIGATAGTPQNVGITCNNLTASVNTTVTNVTLTPAAPSNSAAALFTITCQVSSGGAYQTSTVVGGGATTVPAVPSAASMTINMTAPASVPTTTTITFTNNGVGPLNVNLSPAPVAAPPSATPTLIVAGLTYTTGTGAFTAIPAAGTRTISITCNSAASVSGALTITHDGTSTTPVVYTINCTVAAGGAPLYSASVGSTNFGSASGTVPTLSATTATSGTASLVITNSGTGPLVVTPTITGTGFSLGTITCTAGTAGTVGTASTISGGGGTCTLPITCSSTTAATFTGSLSVAHNAASVPNPIVYTLNCTVSTATTAGTATVTATGGAPVSSSAITQCSSNTVLSTPFPQNAAGEFLFVNCFTIVGAGAVSIPLTQILTNTASGVRDSDRTTITSNAGLLSVWRMGSWFLVSDGAYNPATQAYTFTSAAGTNIYGFFYGAITRPVGAQTSSFAGTTTGDVEDAIRDINEPQKSRASLIAAILSTLFVFFVGMIFLTRRQQAEQPVDAAG